MTKDRSHYPVRRTTLDAQDEGSGVEHLTASERVAMVWQITCQALLFKDGDWHEPRHGRRSAT